MGSLPDSKYIIQTDGYYFVESHDVDPSKGYITVSAKGVINGLSNQPNDGADFGPDTYNPNYTGSGIPYTQTSGLQEAFNYVVKNSSINTGYGGSYTLSACDIKINAGGFTINSPIVIDTSTLPAASSGGLGFLHVRCEGANTQFNVNTPGNYGIEIPGDNSTTNMGLIWEGGTYVDTSTSNGFIKWDFGAIATSGSAWATFYGTNFNEQNPSGHTVFMRGLWTFQMYGNMGSSVSGADWYIRTWQSIVWDSQVGIFPSNTEAQVLNVNSPDIRINGASGVSLDATERSIETCSLSHIWGRVTFVANSSGANVMNILSIKDSYNLSVDIQNRISNLIIDGCLASTNSPPVALLSNTNSSVTGAIWFLQLRNILLYQNNTSMYDNTNLTIEYSDIALNNGNAKSSVLPTNVPFNSPTTPSVPTSGTAQSNTNPYPVNVYLYGGTVTVIDYTPNGGSATQVGTAGPATVRLNPGDSITLTYSGTPTWNWVAV